MTDNLYTPRFPRSVCGGKHYRKALRRPECEALGQRLERIYRWEDLSETNRRSVLLAYDRLTRADKLFITGRMVVEPLPATDLRPENPVSVDIEHLSGSIARIREFVERVEAVLAGNDDI